MTDLLATADAVPVLDPLAELARIAGVLRDGHDHVLEELNALRRVRGSAGGSNDVLRETTALWERLLGQLTRTLAAMSSLGLEAYSIKVSEGQGRQMVEAVTWLLGQLGLAEDETARTAAQRMFAALAGGFSPGDRRVLTLDR